MKAEPISLPNSRPVWIRPAIVTAQAGVMLATPKVTSAVIQTFIRVREQVYSNLIGLHVTAGSTMTVQATTQFSGPFGARPTGLGAVALQGAGTLANLGRREAYVLAYIDSFWLIGWAVAAAMLLVLLLPTPPPNPLTPPRNL